jgi:hypothetical protein
LPKARARSGPFLLIAKDPRAKAASALTTGIQALIDFALLLCENPRERPLLRGQWRQPAVPLRGRFQHITEWLFFNIMEEARDHGLQAGPA